MRAAWRRAIRILYMPNANTNSGRQKFQNSATVPPATRWRRDYLQRGALLVGVSIRAAFFLTAVDVAASIVNPPPTIRGRYVTRDFPVLPVAPGAVTYSLRICKRVDWQGGPHYDPGQKERGERPPFQTAVRLLKISLARRRISQELPTCGIQSLPSSEAPSSFGNPPGRPLCVPHRSLIPRAAH